MKFDAFVILLLKVNEYDEIYSRIILLWDANKGSSVQIKYHPYK